MLFGVALVVLHPPVVNSIGVYSHLFAINPILHLRLGLQFEPLLYKADESNHRTRSFPRSSVGGEKKKQGLAFANP